MKTTYNQTIIVTGIKTNCLPFVKDGKTYEMVEFSYLSYMNKDYKGLKAQSVLIGKDKLQKILDYSKTQLEVGHYYSIWFKKWDDSKLYKLNSIREIAKLEPQYNIIL